jgi:hypothetical protein
VSARALGVLDVYVVVQIPLAAELVIVVEPTPELAGTGSKQGRSR